MPELTLSQVADLAGGELEGEGSRVIRGVSTLQSATESDLSFVANARYAVYLQGTRAAAVLVPRGLGDLPEGIPRIRVDDAHAALARILPVLFPETRPEPGVHPTAHVAEGVELADGVSVGPYAVVGRGARVGAGSILEAHVVVGEGCHIGEECTLRAHATLYPGVRIGNRCILHSGARIGSDGFGYAWDGERHRKIPQVGGCVLGDEVEVGANATIDRGSVGDTVIGAGTKIDNLVHVGHNVKVGENVLLIAQVGIAGSVTVGDAAILAGQAGVGGHLSIGAGARVGAQAGVTGDVPPGETVSGYPARPHREALRAQAATFKVPDLMKRLRELERAVFGKRRG